MTTMDQGRGRRPAMRLSDEHCKTVTYRGRTALRCKLCGRMVAGVLAHFESTHPLLYAAAFGRGVTP